MRSRIWLRVFSSKQAMDGSGCMMPSFDFASLYQRCYGFQSRPRSSLQKHHFAPFSHCLPYHMQLMQLTKIGAFSFDQRTAYLVPPFPFYAGFCLQVHRSQVAEVESYPLHDVSLFGIASSLYHCPCLSVVSLSAGVHEPIHWGR